MIDSNSPSYSPTTDLADDSMMAAPEKDLSGISEILEEIQMGWESGERQTETTQSGAIDMEEMGIRRAFAIFRPRLPLLIRGNELATDGARPGIFNPTA